MKGLRRKTTSPSPSMLKGKSVCVIEDDPDQVNILQTMLKDTGCALEVFTSGEEALERLMATSMDLILADVMMPGLDGWELHSRVRAEGPNRETPFIFTTCVINRNQETLMTDIPALTLSIAKPFNKEKLLKSIARLMG
ncbi:MAG: response regulator [Oceanipulchritudo sp.]